MSDSNRRAIIAAIGLAALACVQPISDDARGQSSASETQSKPESKSKPSAPTAVQDGITGVTRALKAEKHKHHSYSEQERGRRDLRAQERMAKWAKAMFWVALAQAILSFAGILAIWRNLVLTRRSIDTAARGTKAAEESVRVAQDTAKRELRAYFLYDVAQILDFGPNLRASVRLIFKNYGQTPASDVVMWVAIDLLPFPLVEPLPRPPIGPLWSRTIVGPACTTRHIQAVGRPLTTDEVASVLARQAVIYVWGEALYKDVFGQDQRTGYCLIYGGQDGPHPEGLFSAYHEGNSAT